MKTFFISLVIVISAVFAGIKVDVEYNLVSSVNPDMDIMELVNNTPELNTRDEGVVAFYNYSSENLTVTAGEPAEVVILDIYTDMERAVRDMTFYVNGPIAEIGFQAEIVGFDGSVLTPTISSVQLTDNLAGIVFFNSQTALWLYEDVANEIRLVVHTEDLGDVSGQFFFNTEEWTYNPEPNYIWPEDGYLFGSNLEVLPNELDEVIVDFVGPESQTILPGTSDVTMLTVNLETNVPAEIQKTRIEIHNNEWDLQVGSYWDNHIYNIRVVNDLTGETTSSVSSGSFSNIPGEMDGIYYEFTDYFSILPDQLYSFSVKMDFSSAFGSTDWYVVWGNSVEGYTFDDTSIKNTDNNQWITEIEPNNEAITGNLVSLLVPSLGVSSANNHEEISIVQGAEDVNFGDFAFNAGEASDMTFSSLTFTGYIGPNSSECEPGVFYYENNSTSFNNIASDFRIYDVTQDPNMENNLNSTAENFSTYDGRAIFGNMDWTIPAGETHILRIVGNISNAAYHSGWIGYKLIKVNIASVWDVYVQDENETSWLITDNSGSEFDPYNLNGPVNSFLNSYYLRITDAGMLMVYAEDNPPIVNVIAGFNDIPMQNLKFQAINEAFDVNKIRIRQGELPLYNRAVESVTISYHNEAGETVVANQVMIDGNADFNITSNPFYIPENDYRIMNVYFNVPAINQTSATYTGDRIKAEFIHNENFEAHSAGSGSTDLSETSNSIDIHSNTMIVHGNVPVIIPDTETNMNLINGPVELYRWEYMAPEGGTNLAIKKLPFKLDLLDSVPNSSILRLNDFRIYEGDSYETATQLESGSDGYEIYYGNYPGTELTNTWNYVTYDESISNHDIFVVFNDDRIVTSGSSKYYILKATAQNVNTGNGSCDQISTYMYDGDMEYQTPMRLEPTCEGAAMDYSPGQYCLSTDGENNDTGAYMIWSDMTGTYGDFIHTDVNWGAEVSSLDWFNGYKIDQLDITRTLGCNNDDSEPRGDLNEDGMINVVDIIQLINWIFDLPTQYQLLLADMNEDGILNVVDVVLLVDAILQLDLVRSLPTQALISISNNQFQLQSDGLIAGFEIYTSKNVQITNNLLPSGWIFQQNGNHILAASMDGSELPNTLFEYTGNFEPTNILLSDWSGNAVPITEITPSEFKLQPAYPNPFNPITTIGYELPNDSFVQVVIYDMNGRKVANLWNGQQTSGNYQLTWNADDFSSGVYLVTLVTENFATTQKIALVK